MVGDEEDAGGINDHLSCVLEIHRDAPADDGLHLAEAPVRLVWVAHEIARLEEAVHRNPFALPARVSVPGSDGPDLSALVGARLCHDLISPLGAIRNGLELLQMSAPGGEDSAEIGLISESLETALAKLRYFRLAFGPADPLSRQSFGEAVQATDAMFSGRFSVAWETRGLDMPRPRARAIYLAILCLEKSLPMGGLVRVSVAEDAVRFAVEGRRTAPPVDLWAHVTDGGPLHELRADCVQFAMLRQALVETGLRMSASFTDTGAALALFEPVRQPA